MSRTARVVAFLGDGDYPMRLAIGQLVELQDRTEAGPAELLDRLRSGRWRVADVIQTLRLALIGGGMEPKAAYDHVLRHVVEARLYEHLVSAVAVLGAAILGVEEDAPPKVGEPKAGARKSRRSRKAANAGDGSTSSAP